MSERGFAPGAFELSTRTRLVGGPGSISRLGELAKEIGGRDVLLVSDPGIVAAGHVDTGERLLRDAGLRVGRFDGAHENPTTADVDACTAFAKQGPVDLVVGLGGGSSIDVAKGALFLLAGGGRMEDYWGVGKLGRPAPPLIAVPTTAGTGSEAQSFALVARESDHQKMACGDPAIAPRVSLLDPELTLTMPREVTVCTGLDAIGHAVESAVTKVRNPISSLFSRESFRLAIRALPRVLASPDDLDARGDMITAAAFAGLAIEHSMLGAAHSMANPLTAHHGIAHGRAVGVALPYVVEHNASDPEVAAIYGDLMRSAGLDAEAGREGEALARCLRSVLEAAGEPTSFAGLGVPDGAAEALSPEAARQWTAQFNPVAVGEEDFERLLGRACAETVP